MITISKDIIINAPASIVWNTLLDFEKVGEWNDFIKAIKGKPIAGTTLENTLQLEGQKPQVFKPTVLKVAEQKELRWLGSLFVKGLFDGEHYFILEAVEQDKTLFRHGENFSGILSKVIFNMVGEATQKGFENFNEGLKRVAEQQFVASKV